MRLFSNRSQKTSKCGKNISDTLGCASCATFLFLPHFDVICDLLLNRRTATWNLFAKWQGKSERFDWFFLGQDFPIRTVSIPFPWKRSSAVYFLFSKAGKFITCMAQLPSNKLFTNLAISSSTVEYWPSVVFVRISLRSVRTATTSDQYSAVRPSRSVNKRLVLTPTLLLFYKTRFDCQPSRI